MLSARWPTLSRSYSDHRRPGVETITPGAWPVLAGGVLTAMFKRETVRGVSLFTRMVGAGPPVVVLHGGPGAHHDYLLPQYDEFARGRSLRYYDQRGGGQSPVDRNTPLGWQEHVEDLDALRDRWRIDRLTLLGYSWGGLLALLYAATHPERVGRLALVAPVSMNQTLRDEGERRFQERMADPELIRAREALQHSDLRVREPDAYRQRAFALSVWGYFKNPARAQDLTPFRVTERTRRMVWKSLGSYDLQSALGAVRAPSLIVHGRHDPVPLEGSQALADVLGAKLVVLENAGHASHVESFGEFFAPLDQFLPRT